MENRDRALGMLPDVFKMSNGARVKSREEWELRREEIISKDVALEFGGMPGEPDKMETETLFIHRRLHSYRSFVNVDGKTMAFVFGVYVPTGFDNKKKYPVILEGDGCFTYCNDAVIEEANKRGYAVVKFNRTEFAPDLFDCDRISGIYNLFENSEFGAISAWAWSYSRIIDAISGIDYLDMNEIAATGHSRGGKTVMLAAALDKRIKYVNPNCSGLHGVNCYRYLEFNENSRDKRSETLADSFRVFPHWMGKGMREYIGRETELPHDMHFFTSLIAPRKLLITAAADDTWCGPKASRQTFLATCPVYRFLGAEDNIAYVLREGNHDHTFSDYCVFFDFIDAFGNGLPLDKKFKENPYPDIERMFTWEVPENKNNT